MKTLFFLCLIRCLIPEQACFASGMIALPEDLILKRDSQMIWDDPTEEEPDIPSEMEKKDMFAKDFIQSLEEEADTKPVIQEVHLTSCYIGDERFEKVYNQILAKECIQNHVKLVELSFISLLPDDKSLEIFAKVLALPQLRILKIDGIGNAPQSMKRLAQLLKKCQKEEDVLEKMGKIIFDDEDFIIANQKAILAPHNKKLIECVQKHFRPYHVLVDEGYLPKNWIQLHEEFYGLPITRSEERLSLTSSETRSQSPHSPELSD